MNAVNQKAASNANRNGLKRVWVVPAPWNLGCFSSTRPSLSLTSPSIGSIAARHFMIRQQNGTPYLALEEPGPPPYFGYHPVISVTTKATITQTTEFFRRWRWAGCICLRFAPIAFATNESGRKMYHCHKQRLRRLRLIAWFVVETTGVG